MMHLRSSVLVVAVAASASWLVGCGGHEARTLRVRNALDAGDPKVAIAAINEELSVGSDADYPKKVEGDDALLVLDRATLQQSLVQFEKSKRDFEVADKAIDMLDLGRGTSDSFAEYVFSDSAGKYAAPPYEKLLINTLNLVNYLELGDLGGARVEARRLAVMARYYKDHLPGEDTRVLGVGAALAGFAFEQSGEGDEALRWYDEALARGRSDLVRDGVRRLVAAGATYSSPRIKEAVSAGDGARDGTAEGVGERAKPEPGGDVVVIVGSGRVPHKIANRIPIGLALTLYANSIQPSDQAAANRLAAQGLVTWINFPSLAPGEGSHAHASCSIDGRTVALEEAADVEREVRAQWKKIEGKVIVSAITRMVARVAVGEGIRAASGRDNVVGLLASLGAQATLSAMDTPDTRSWETLPSHITFARLRLPPGRHRIVLEARGARRDQAVDVKSGGFRVVSLLSLR